MSIASQTTRKKFGWNKIIVAISLLVMALAFFVLFHLLRDIDVDRVIAAMRAVPTQTILTAGIFVALGYLTLTFYDYFALRTIGRVEIPYRIAVLASFTSYTIGHNLGATVFTGGAVRLRIYSAWGLNIMEVAKLAFVTGLTFWLGNAFVLGVAMAYAPDAASAVNQLPPWINRAIGLAALATIAGYLMWLLPRPRVLGRDDWQVVLPSAPLTLVQIVIGVLDLGAGALAMYTLLPTDPAIDFISLVVIFVVATLLGFISHAPGSLGVFDAAVLVALTQYPKEDLLASLLLFRVLYFILPFCLALCVLTVRELWLNLSKQRDAADDPPSA